MRTLLAGLVMLAACGGGGGGEPLISGSVTGEYEGTAFTATHGFAADVEGTLAIVIGSGDIGCGSVDDNEPPDGINAAIGMESLAVGTYTNVSVLLHFNIGHYEAHGTGGGTVTITASSPESIAGSIDWLTVDAGLTYSVTGTFEIASCL
jgi:hypothetical protein